MVSIRGAWHACNLDQESTSLWVAAQCQCCLPVNILSSWHWLKGTGTCWLDYYEQIRFHVQYYAEMKWEWLNEGRTEQRMFERPPIRVRSRSPTEKFLLGIVVHPNVDH